MKTMTFNIQGMTCGGCVSSITRVLNDTAGVIDAKVDLASATAIVQFDTLQIDEISLIEVIENAGFDAQVA